MRLTLTDVHMDAASPEHRRGPPLAGRARGFLWRVAETPQAAEAPYGTVGSSWMRSATMVPDGSPALRAPPYLTP